MNVTRQQLMILTLFVLVLAVCAFPSRIPLKRTLESKNVKGKTLVKRVQEILPRSLQTAELKHDLAKLSARSFISEGARNGYKRSARRCAAGHIHYCFGKSSGRRRNVMPN